MKSAFAFAPAFAAAAAAICATAHAEPVTYSVDPSHTFANFEVTAVGTSTLRGRFDKKEGTVLLDRAAKSGKVDITIDTTSISTGTPALDARLKSKDFFDVAQHPSARFVGDRFVFEGDKLASVAGTLTLLGRTQPVTLAATRFNCYTNPLFKREVCGGDFEATIQRSRWGMDSALQTGAPDAVRLLVQVEAIRQ